MKKHQELYMYKVIVFHWYLYNTGTLNFQNFNTDLRTI